MQEKLITSIFIFSATLITAGPAVAVGSSNGEPEETQTNVGDPETGFYSDDGYPKQTDRPAINSDFDPDENCDPKWELKCIPGSQQDCPEGFNNGEMNVCTLIGCPDGYHNISEDEDNICYSNEIDCPNNWILVKNEYGETCKESE
jgi:hypothetical protein